ncbi:cadherin-like domain-containing protein, partial [Asticcacaulis sp. AC402]|uniref:cadherin-like domain-containing protein n=1 Tax=Asticcacaulis sp. AC402 TaxID=1282361 RepID=UPI0005908C67
LVTVTYTVSDGNGGEQTGLTRTFSLGAVNDAPRGAPTGTVVDGTEDTAQTILASTLLQGFSDVEGQTLSVSNISVSNGTLATTTGGWIFTPAANYNGPVTVTYTVSDGNGGTL